MKAAAGTAKTLQQPTAAETFIATDFAERQHLEIQCAASNDATLSRAKKSSAHLEDHLALNVHCAVHRFILAALAVSDMTATAC